MKEGYFWEVPFDVFDGEREIKSHQPTQDITSDASVASHFVHTNKSHSSIPCSFTSINLLDPSMRYYREDDRLIFVFTEPSLMCWPSVLNLFIIFLLLWIPVSQTHVMTSSRCLQISPTPPHPLSHTSTGTPQLLCCIINVFNVAMCSRNVEPIWCADQV